MSSLPEKQYLEAAEKALENKDYESAIAQLKKLSQNTKNLTLLSTAQKRLIVAYQNSGKIAEAIPLCQHLQNTAEIQDQIWATNQLTALNQAQISANITGFVADQSSSSSSANQPSFTEKKSSDQSLKESSNLSPSPTKKTIKPPVDPEENTKTSPATKTTPSPEIPWKNVPKPKTWKPLKRPSLSPLWRNIFISLSLFFLFINTVTKFFMEVTNHLLVELPSVRPFQPFYRDPTIALAVFVLVVFLTSPWLLNGLLKIIYQCQTFPLYKLTSRYPVTVKLIQRYCNQKKIPFPKLGLLPTPTPIIFSYGHSPKNACIVFSEGLLTQLSDEEIATLIAGEIATIGYFPLYIFSGAIALLQVPYTLYSQITLWGETLYQRLPKQPPRFIPHWFWRDIPPLVRNSAADLGGFFYLAYRLWKIPLNLLFQAQHSYKDYLSVSLTGDPNGKIRGLIKIAIGMTQEMVTQKETSWLVESFSPLFPIGYGQGFYLGSLSGYLSLETILSWEKTQKEKYYLNGFPSHPIISDRVCHLSQFAKRYQLPLELDISLPKPPEKSLRKRLEKLINTYQTLPLLQKSLCIGITLGVILRLLLWGMGMISNQLDIMLLAWLTDTEDFLTACILFIFSLSLILGTNHYFPNVKVSNANNNPSLSRWLTTINHPQEVSSLRISGELLGRSGISNWLGQDLILKTSTGIIFLHISSRLGIIGNLLPNFPRPNQFVKQPVIVSGWLRRGVIPWLDVERMTNNKRQSFRANYPIWLTILAVIAAAWGTQLVLQA